MFRILFIVVHQNEIWKSAKNLKWRPTTLLVRKMWLHFCIIIIVNSKKVEKKENIFLKNKIESEPKWLQEYETFLHSNSQNKEDIRLLLIQLFFVICSIIVFVDQHVVSCKWRSQNHRFWKRRWEYFFWDKPNPRLHCLDDVYFWLYIRQQLKISFCETHWMLLLFHSHNCPGKSKFQLICL